MAKGKNAAALFEVMNKSRFPGGRTASNAGEGGFPTPKWWFKSRNGGDVKVMAPDEPPASMSAAPMIEEPVVRPAPVRETPLVSSIDLPDMSPTAASPRTQPVAVSVDSDRQQINLRLSYTSALIGGFGVFIALGLAVLIGKGLSHGPSPAIANTSTQQLKQRAATPGVLNVPRRGTTGRNYDVTEDPTVRTSGSASTGTRNPQQSFNDPRPPATFFTDDAHRSSGLNYAIIQSYPDKATAEKTAEFLTKNGIPCTVEKDLPNWPLPWRDGCVVVGIRGFGKMSRNPELEAYKKAITDVSAKFTNGRTHASGFTATMYLWRKSN
jgi:hypothetical protein